MIKSNLRYIIQLAILIAVLLPINYFVLVELMHIEFSRLYYFSYLYYIILVFIIQIMMSRALKDRPQNYIISFMASMGVKMFLSLGILVVIMYPGLNSSKYFAINYLLLYLIFSAFSIFQMLQAQREVSGKK